MSGFKDLMRAFLYEEVDDDDEELEEEADETSDGFTVTAASDQAAAPNQTGANPAVQNPVHNQAPAGMENPYAASPYPAQQTGMPQSMPVNPLPNQPAAAYPNPQINPYANPAAPVSPYGQYPYGAYPQQEAPVHQEKKNESFGLDMDDVARPDNPIKESKPYRYDRRKIQTVRHKNTEQTEYQAVLSPIFGNIEDEEKSFESVHDAINLPKPAGDVEMSTVISPMFGNASKETRSKAAVSSVPNRKKAAPSKEEKGAPKDLADFLIQDPIRAYQPVSRAETKSAASQTDEAGTAEDQGESSAARK